MQYVNRKGFTLIELLVVIAIIAILGGLLLPAINGVRKKGYEARARTEVKSLEMAVKAFLNEYNKYPGGPITGGNDFLFSGANKLLIEPLKGVDPAENPRKIIFLEVSGKATNSVGDMVDPWKNPYRIAMDTDFDNEVDNTGDSSQPLVSGRSVIVYSTGPDSPTSTDSYIRSWE